MPVETIAQFMARYPNSNAVNVAGYVDGNTFRYFESTSVQLPAFVNALEAVGGRKANIYTNFAQLWVAPSGNPCPNVRALGYLAQAPATNVEVRGTYTSVAQTEKKWPARIVGTSGAAPIAIGGLYREASLTAEVTGGYKPEQDPAAGSGARGIRRALRLYMLACYAILDRSATAGFPGLNNYVAALLVSDTGKILAAGVNTGSYRHAEVSLLLAYFRDNPTALKLPDNCVVFSTLTPCKQCSGYLTQAAPELCKIYFGQDDPGKDGRAGRNISKQLSDTTKAPKGFLTPELRGGLGDEEFGGAGVVSKGKKTAMDKVALRHGLESCMGPKSKAGQIGKAGQSRAMLASADKMLEFKGGKDRADTDENRIKRAVLDHVNVWLKTAVAQA